MNDDRQGRYLKPGNRVSAPGVVWTVEVHCKGRAVGHTIRAVAQSFESATVTLTTYRRGRWTPLQVWECPTPADVRATLDERAVQGRINWVLTPLVTSTLTLLRWWDYVNDVGCEWVSRRAGRPVLPLGHESSGTVFLDTFLPHGRSHVCGYTRLGTRWRWVSEANYWPDGRPVRRDRGPADAGTGRGGDRPSGEGAHPVQCGARGASDHFTALCDWWRRTARAPFGTTIGQLSVGMLRSHAPPRVLCSHGDDDVHRLERRAAFGGRATCWFVGEVGVRESERSGEDVLHPGRSVQRLTGPITHVDVRSMYPYLLREEWYPVKLLSYRENVPPRAPVELARDLGVIADVLIDTRVPEYPRRRGDRIDYPIGRFQTTLTGPELLALSNDGEIIKCHAMATYRMDRPFGSACTALLRLRAEACSAGAVSSEGHAKLLANSLAGKLAQRAGGWVRSANLDDPGNWGESYHYDLRTGARVRARHANGWCWTWTPDASGRGPYTFAFAYLAAYGRLTMRRYRAALPPRAVVSQDTDGLWVTAAGLEALAALDASGLDQPGDLRVTATAHTATFYGPRHYCVDGEWTLAGFHKPVVSDDGNTVKDTYDQSIWAERHFAPPSETIRRVRESHLTLSDIGGDVGEDGWVTPRRVGRAGCELE